MKGLIVKDLFFILFFYGLLLCTSISFHFHGFISGMTHYRFLADSCPPQDTAPQGGASRRDGLPAVPAASPAFQPRLTAPSAR